MERKLTLTSVDVYVALGGKGDDFANVISATPQEAFTLMAMPALVGSIIKLVPCYELPEMPEKEG